VKLEHTFTVPADLETVWQAVLDPERVAPCMPGATLGAVDGDTFTGQVKVRVGPISLLYKGSGEFLEKSAADRRVVIKAAGKDARGNGTASATVTVTLRADGEVTAGSVATELSITGKPAQFGRGLISEVGGKILDSFATCLASKLAPAAPVAAPTLSVVERERAAAVETGRHAGEAAAANAPAPTKPRLAAAPDPEPEPIDLLAYAGPSVLKRVAPLAAMAAAVLAFVALRRRGR
jgi:uncharacterized protein